MQPSLEARLRKAEQRFAGRTADVHRYTDDELDGLIAWLREPDPATEAWAVSLLRREGLLP